jgi:predicted SAM-dependent methyltransferase
MRYELRKFREFSSKYGLVHTMFSGLGRKYYPLWSIFGPFVSRNYAKEYCDSLGPKGLNLGSGSNLIQGMLNVDIDPRADAWVDIKRALPFCNATFDVIFSEEVLEHVTENEGLELLKECFRIMKPGGCIHISTPNLNYFSGRIEGGLHAVREMNDIFYEHGHKFIYSLQALEAVLEKAGFNEIRFYNYKDPCGYLSHFDSHADRFQHDPKISLYVEATKTGSDANVAAFRC